MKQPDITSAAGVAKKLVDRIEKEVDIRENSEYRAAAMAMGINDSIGDLSKEDAARLSRAIEEIHGARTSTQRDRDGKIRVWRIEPRPHRTRTVKPKVAGV